MNSGNIMILNEMKLRINIHSQNIPKIKIVNKIFSIFALHEICKTKKSRLANMYNGYFVLGFHQWKG